MTSRNFALRVLGNKTTSTCRLTAQQSFNIQIFPWESAFVPQQSPWSLRPTEGLPMSQAAEASRANLVGHSPAKEDRP
jgi:hypothetical protein